MAEAKPDKDTMKLLVEAEYLIEEIHSKLEELGATIREIMEPSDWPRYEEQDEARDDEDGGGDEEHDDTEYIKELHRRFLAEAKPEGGRISVANLALACQELRVCGIYEVPANPDALPQRDPGYWERKRAELEERGEIVKLMPEDPKELRKILLEELAKDPIDVNEVAMVCSLLHLSGARSVELNP